MIARTPQQERNRTALIGPLVLFDGLCILCNGSVRFLLPRDRTGRLHFAPIQSEVGQQVLQRHRLPLQEWDSFVFLDEGRVYLKAEALIRIVCFMGWPWRALSLLRYLLRSVGDWFYDRVACNRYALFGPRPACMMPEEAHRERFFS